MTSKNKKIWFPAKTYGYGWGPPICWQGWMVVSLFVILLSSGAWFFLQDEHPFLFITYAVFLSCLLTTVCWLKGEKPGWRWGKEEKP